MNQLIISPSPHIHGKESTSTIMRDVIIALIPSLSVSVYFFGFSAVKLILVGVLSCVLIEYLIERLTKREVTIKDYSAVLTGLLLALNLPPTSPWWMIVIGSFVAIAIAKLSFGGLGQNLFNPAIVGRVFLLASFPVLMTDWSVPESWFRTGIDAVSGATPLGVVKEGLAQGLTLSEILAKNDFSYGSMLFTKIGGSLGEVSALALILGFIYLIFRRVIKPHIPLAILITIAVISGTLHIFDPDHFSDPLFNILTGGVLLGAIFMATDYVTSPMSERGMILFGVGIGAITILIRFFGAYPEGISFAILIMNAFVPLINMYIKPKRFAKTVKMEVKNG